MCLGIEARKSRSCWASSSRHFFTSSSTSCLACHRALRWSASSCRFSTFAAISLERLAMAACRCLASPSLAPFVAAASSKAARALSMRPSSLATPARRCLIDASSPPSCSRKKASRSLALRNRCPRPSLARISFIWSSAWALAAAHSACSALAASYAGCASSSSSRFAAAICTSNSAASATRASWDSESAATRSSISFTSTSSLARAETSRDRSVSRPFRSRLTLSASASASASARFLRAMPSWVARSRSWSSCTKARSSARVVSSESICSRALRSSLS
mmetsp:Transcript_51256/g.116526  ORF Transcript_51256/g.116526 Transcript_51256/m.116526 type:complete len:279 (-) Transcript_51256:313-1149(-)